MLTEPGNALPAARGGEGGAGVSSMLCRFTEFAVRAGAEVVHAIDVGKPTSMVRS